MKVNFKRVATAALAVAMSLSLAVPAFAEVGDPVANQILTVKGAQLEGKNVTIVKMFDATITEAAVENKYEYADYELIDAWDTFFTTGTSSTPAGIGLTGTGDALSEAAVNYVQKLKNDEIATFADKAQTWYRAKKGTDLSGVTTFTEEGGEGDTVTFNSVEPGYYLVFPEGGSTGDDGRNTDAILVNVPSNEYGVTVNIKSTYPTVDKMVNDGNDNTLDKVGADKGNADNGSAQVGDIVTFTLKSKVPDMSDYTTSFYFGFTDTLSNGLKVVDNAGKDVADGDNLTIDGLTVTIGGETVTGYTVSLRDNVLKVEFTNLKNVVQANQPEDIGKDIVVTYKAMITEDAISTNPATNEVKVEYSNDPTTNNKGESTPDISKVYTYDIDVNKWALSGQKDDPETEEEDESKIKNLAGAEFILSTNKTAPNDTQISSGYSDYEGLIKLVGSSNSYRVAKPDDTPKANSFITTNTGDIKISGLEAGTYYLHEVKAPDGYNKLKDPVKIVITITNMDTGAATITVNDGPASGDGTTVDVENKKGIELPETGSIGTIGLTALGVVVVVAGLFAFPRKKKTRQD